MALTIEQFTCRSDNFGVLIHDPAADLTAAIDGYVKLSIRHISRTLGDSRYSRTATVVHKPRRS